MHLSLDFGSQGTFLVDLDGVTEDQYAKIEDYFLSLIADRHLKAREAIAMGFVYATRLCPDANPSDVWHHVLYRIYVRNKVGVSPGQSWVRASGEAFEIALEKRYNPVLEQYGFRFRSLISGQQKRSALQRMRIAHRAGSQKIDLLIEKEGQGRQRIGGFGAVGGIHAKVSLAERVSDDIPASRIMMDEGLISVLCTLDVKSFPPPHGDLINRGELGSPDMPSDKRKYVEEHGDFDICISYNNRTIPSSKSTTSGRQILIGSMDQEVDALVTFLESRFS